MDTSGVVLSVPYTEEGTDILVASFTVATSVEV